MNRLAYLEQRRVFTIAAQWSHLSPAIATLVEHGRIVSTTHRVALQIAVRQLRSKVSRGRGYCLKCSQLETLQNFAA